MKKRLCICFLILFLVVLASSFSLAIDLKDYNKDNIIDVKDLVLSLNMHIIPGDATQDSKVDIFDLAKVGINFGKTSEDVDWDSTADVANTIGEIDIFDLAMVGLNYNKIYPTQTAGTIVFISPDYKEVYKNESFIIELRINTNASVYAVEGEILFDPSIIQTNSVQEGNFLNQDGAGTFPIANINNTEGRIGLANTRFGVQTGVSGVGSLAIINFSAISAGSSIIGIGEGKLVDPNLQEIEAETANGTIDVVTNKPPIINSFFPLTNPTINESQSQKFNVSASDPENDPITYKWYLDGISTGVTTKSYTYNADFNSSGIHNVTVFVSDNQGNNVSKEWSLTVINVNRKPSNPTSANLTPTIAYTDTLFSCNASGSTDADLDPITYYYEFRKGATKLQNYSTNNIYSCSSVGCNKNDNITCYAKAFDSTDFSVGEKASNSVRILNSLPTQPTSVSLQPTIVYTNTLFSCNASNSTDADNDALTYYFEFRKPGTTLRTYSTNNSYSCSLVGCNKNDNITCYAKAYDLTNYSAEKASNSVVVLNSIPSQPTVDVVPNEPKITDNLFCNITKLSSDIDGDSLTYKYKWYKNNILQAGLTGNIVNSSNLAKNDEWKCNVSANDGEIDSLEGSDFVIVGNLPPSASNLQITPALPKTNDDLIGNYNYSDPESDPESGTEIRWYKNSVLQSAYNDLLTVLASATSKGEKWYFTVKPKDGLSFGNLQTSANVTIQNTAPTTPTTATLNPTIAYKNTNFICNASGSSDVDLDTITYYFEFRKSGSTLQAYSTSSSYICGTNCNKNDNITCYAKAYDGSAYSSELGSNSVIILNSAPVLSAIGNKTGEENFLLEFTVSASDADSDILAYSAENLPTGASFNAGTRKFSWTPDFEQAGTYYVSFNVSDGEEADSETIMIIIISTNRAPVIYTYLPETNPTINEGESQEFSINASDPDGDEITVIWKVNEIEVGDGNSYIYNSTKPNGEGIYNIKAVVSDGDTTATKEWTLTVRDTIIRINIKAGQSIFSLPRNAGEIRFSDLNTNCVLENMHICSKPFAYYTPSDNLTTDKYVCLGANDILYPGQGYFIIVKNDCYFEIKGELFGQEQIGYLGSKELKTGWNLMGSSAQEETFNSGSCQLYGGIGAIKYVYDVTSCNGVKNYNGRYQDCKIEYGVSRCGCSVDILEPGLGYWIRTKNDCSLV